MQKKKSIFDFLTNVLVIYGVTVLLLSVFCVFIGEQAAEHSTIFAFENDGLAAVTLLQFLLLAFLITVYQWICCTDILIKNWSVTLRTILMFVLIIVTMGILAKVFGWFPVDMPEAWAGFFVSFFVCAAASVGTTILKEKMENKKLQDALERLKEGEI